MPTRRRAASKPVLPSANELLLRLSKRLDRSLDKAIVWAQGHERALTPSDEFGSAYWTNALLNSVLKEGAKRDFEVWPGCKYLAIDTLGVARNRNNARKKGSSDRGEWMLDACWTSYPPLGAWIKNLLAAEQDGGGGIALACESEWGSRAGGEIHLRMVLHDFAKLVAVQAPMKLMFFGYFEDDEVASFERIKSLCRKVAAKDRYKCTYLLMGWPYFSPWRLRKSFKKDVFTPAQARSRKEAGQAPRPSLR